MSNDFFSKCAPLSRVGIDSCAGLTLCNLSPTTADELLEIYQDTNGRWRLQGALVDSDIMAAACQIEESPLYKFIRANMRDWGTKSLTTVKTINSGLYEVQPFVKVGRKNLINNNYWKFTKTGNSGTVSGITYDITGTAESLTSIPADAAWFPEGLQVHISGRSDAGTATHTQFKVVYASVTGNSVQIYLRSQNSGSTLPGSKLQTPSSGVLFRGVNNSNPYEANCAQIPRLNTNSSFLAFYQSSRWSLCNDELTKKFKQLVLEGNPLYREYFHIDEVEYNKQVLQDWQNRLVHSFLFGKAFNNQDENNWPKLDVIEAMTDGLTGDFLYLNGIEGRCVGRRANVKGVYEQLNECGRVVDLQGDVLNWPELQSALYDLYRVRKTAGNKNPGLIEVVVDSAYRVQFVQGLIRYLKMRYEDTLRFNHTIGEEKQSPHLGFTYQDFKLDFPAGVTLRVVSDLAFDDYVSAHRNAGGEALATASRWALFLDWSGIYMANIAQDTVDLATGDIKDVAKINSDAFCRMKLPSRSIRHYHLMWTAVVECPAANLWFENIGFGVPEHEFKHGNPNLSGGRDSYFDYAGSNPSND